MFTGNKEEREPEKETWTEGPGRGETGLFIHVGHIHGKPTPQPKRQEGGCVCPSGAISINAPENQSFSAASSEKNWVPPSSPDRLNSNALLLEDLAARNKNLE